MLVVVTLLTNPKVRVIIPQEWIMGHNQENVNNYGKNGNQDRCIFFTTIGASADGLPDQTILPKFNLALSHVYPSESEETCYKGRIIKYCDTVEKAIYYRDVMRPTIPVTHNERRVFEAPIPPSSPNANENGNLNAQADGARSIQPPNMNLNEQTANNATNIVDDVARELALANMNLCVQTQNAAIELDDPNELNEIGDLNVDINVVPAICSDGHTENANNSNELNANGSLCAGESSGDQTENLFTASANNVNDLNVNGSSNAAEASATGSDHETKYIPVPENIDLNERDAHAIDQVLSAPDESEQFVDENGVLKVKTTCGDMEITSVYGQHIKPIALQLKSNDVLSKNMPFVDNALEDREYLVVLRRGGSQKIKLPGKVVRGLKELNNGAKRNNQALDKRFLKLALVGAFGLQDIKSNNVMNEFKLKLIKDLFEVRVEGNDADGWRFLEFDDLIQKAVAEIKQNIF